MRQISAKYINRLFFSLVATRWNEEISGWHTNFPSDSRCKGDEGILMQDSIDTEKGEPDYELMNIKYGTHGCVWPGLVDNE
ncbi:hypothetical protein CHS0354_036535, partial [Potamilus streckersoni]